MNCELLGYLLEYPSVHMLYHTPELHLFRFVVINSCREGPLEEDEWITDDVFVGTLFAGIKDIINLTSVGLPTIRCCCCGLIHSIEITRIDHTTTSSII